MKLLTVSMRINFRRGQSLIEVLIATAVGAIMIIGAITIIAPALKGNTQANRIQVAAALGKELLENVRVWGEADWHNLANLSSGAANHYYLNASSSPFTVATGTEALVISSTTYTRYFYVESAGRDGGGNIVGSGGTDDPSTRKVTVVYGWSQGPTTSIFSYLTRSQNKSFVQSDWGGGNGQNGPVTSVNNRFASSSAVDFTNTPGSIKINNIPTQ